MELILVIVAIGIAVLIFLQLRQKAPEGDQQIESLARELREQNANLLQYSQRESAALRQEVMAQMKNTTDSFAMNLKTMNDVVNTQLTGVQRQMEATTTAMNKQLDSVSRQMQESTGQVGARLDNAAKVIGEVQKSFGTFQQTTVEIKELHELLRAPKLRGGFGEEMLEEILKQVLPVGSYDMQYHFKSGDIVDAVVKTASHLIPVDAKFPYENFKKYAEAQEDAEKKTFKKEFDRNVRDHIDKIAKKYILPDEGTFDFALMYIPAENVYYEIIIKDEAFGDGKGIFSYATERRVVPVSPNNFYAYLRVILLGLQGLQIEKNAKAIQENLSRLRIELGNFNDSFVLVGKHLENAKKQYEEADKRLNRFENKLSLAAPTDTENPPMLDLGGE